MEVVLDVDATDDPLHGEQEGRCFHGYYKNDCYLPLYIFCGGHLLCARLRSADEDGASGVVEELEGMVMRIRAKWPCVRVVVRGDGGFCRDESMAWCEGVDYVLGLSKNTRLLKLIGDEMEEARRLHEDSGEAVRLFKELGYRTRKSWSCERRVVAKSGALERWRESAVHRHFDTGRAVVGPRALRGRVLRAGRDGESHQGAAIGSVCGPYIVASDAGESTEVVLCLVRVCDDAWVTPSGACGDGACAGAVRDDSREGAEGGSGDSGKRS